MVQISIMHMAITYLIFQNTYPFSRCGGNMHLAAIILDSMQISKMEVETGSKKCIAPCQDKGSASTTKVMTAYQKLNTVCSTSRWRCNCTLDISNETKATEFKHRIRTTNSARPDSINLLVSSSSKREKPRYRRSL